MTPVYYIKTRLSDTTSVKPQQLNQQNGYGLHNPGSVPSKDRIILFKLEQLNEQTGYDCTSGVQSLARTALFSLQPPVSYQMDTRDFFPAGEAASV